MPSYYSPIDIHFSIFYEGIVNRKSINQICLSSCQEGSKFNYFTVISRLKGKITDMAQHVVAHMGKYQTF